jgi:coenzyme F420-dependent glucose-6-phosphate dehydrogenase
LPEIGYALSSEEHPPAKLVANAKQAERTGFSFALISDHFHPWVSQQGQSPFVWSVLGAIAASTESLRLGTGVTCPMIRTHPAIIAQAAATTACLMPERFFLGIGTGENLNEHVTGQPWPPADLRLEMLEEAVEHIRDLWTGDEVTKRGRFFTTEHARIFTRPDNLPPIYMAASGDEALSVAARISDGLIATAPKPELVKAFENERNGRPKFGMVHVCWGSDESEARQTAHKWWPNAALRGELGQELALPRHFEQAAKNVSEGDVADRIPCGPDPERHLAAINEYLEAGFDHVYIHQVGPNQDGFFDFYGAEVLPKFG